MRGTAYAAGSDDEDDEDNGIAIVDSPRSSPNKAGHGNPTLTTSSSTVLMGGNRKGSAAGFGAQGGQQRAALPEEEASVSDATINARLHNARQRIQQRADGDGTPTPAVATEAWASGAATAGGAAPMTPPRPNHPPQLTMEEVQLTHAQALERDHLAWLQTPVGPGEMLQCFIKRDKTGLDMLYPQYRCYLQTPDGDRFMMAARKRKKSNSNNYVISCSMKDLARHSDNCVGKLRSNFIGTEFVLYDNGYNPKKLPKDALNGRDKNGIGVRKELAVCLNTQNVVGAPTPRKVKGIIPQLVNGKPMEYCPTSEEDTILQRDKDSRMERDFLVMQSKQPKYNNTTGKYSLNFNGRVKLASVKNVQMVFQGQEEVLLQFGKTGKNDFILDFTHPFTPMQAFAFGLTSLAYKLANEGG